MDDNQTCQCRDPLCPQCRGDCRKRHDLVTLYRVDMDDETGTPMCEGCAADAFEAGVFTLRDANYPTPYYVLAADLEADE